jgi:hypothetical protein
LVGVGFSLARTANEKEDISKLSFCCFLCPRGGPTIRPNATHKQWTENWASATFAVVTVQMKAASQGAYDTRAGLTTTTNQEQSLRYGYQ